VDGEQLTSVNRASTIDPFKLGRRGKASATTSGQRSNGQPLASLAPARGDNPAATWGAHAAPKAMGLGSFATLWLVGALHTELLI
jgi:hypothetical protein